MSYFKKEGGIDMSQLRVCRMSNDRMIFYDAIKALDEISYLTYYMKYQLAPVIMGVKPAITLNIGKKQEKKYSKVKILKVIESLGLKGMILRDTPNGHIVLAYRCCQMEQILKQEEVAAVLQNMGYPVHSIYLALSHLRKRYDYCHCPPELGIFLGFPVEDVKDYMCDTQKKCLLCGYWQVYNDVEGAEKIFSQYDEAKNTMLNNLLSELKKKLGIYF